MKKINCTVLVLLILAIAAGCGGRKSSQRGQADASDSLTVPDTGFTGIQKYYNKDFLVKEVTFKNGIRHGEMKTFYKGGQLFHQFLYENDLREDTARWYYVEGQLYRKTPYLHDTIHGTQIQYYRTGSVKAKLHYIKGLRTPLLEEFTRDGKLIKEYPEIVYTITDNYNTTGKVRVNLGISDASRKVIFYHGEFMNGVFDTTQCRLINPISGKSYIDLVKTGSPQPDQIDIIASILTDFGNRYLTYKKIELPYRDLK